MPRKAEHLKKHQFKPGNPGGPGRPKKLPLTERLVKLIEDKFGGPEEARRLLKLGPKDKWGDALMTALLRMSLTKTDAMRLVVEMTEGKTVERVRIEGPDGGPLAIEVKATSLAELAAEILEERKKNANAK